MKVSPPKPVRVESSTDLLGDILTGQSLLGHGSRDIEIQRDG